MATFRYTPVRFPQKCLTKLRRLCLSDREFGAQLVPAVQDDTCKFSCDGVRLIHGTALQDDNPDQTLYEPDPSKPPVRIAVTPFYREVFSVSPLCDSNHSVNMFCHTHPLLLAPENKVGQLSPPSIGDLFAHGILSNYRNFKQNGVINMPLVVAREGLYYYNVLPTRFAREIARIEARLAETGQPVPADGELPADVVDWLKTLVFAELRPLHNRFLDEMVAWAQGHAGSLSLQGAARIPDGPALWSADNVQDPDCCGFDRSIRADWFQHYCRNNALARGLIDLGFFYHYVPAPFTDDVQIPCPTTFENA
jgi:hypothetical protein